MQLIIRLIAHIYVAWQECYWGFVIAYRIFHGRWYVFRGVPTWVVQQLADDEAPLRPDQEHVREEAKTELRLRKVTLSTEEAEVN